MERRLFLQGVFGGITAGGLLLKAQPLEIEAFAAPLSPKQPLILDAPPVPPSAQVHAGEILFNARGERVAIVTALVVEHEQVDYTGWADSYITHGRGPIHIQIRATGLGHLEWPQGDYGHIPRLRG